MLESLDNYGTRQTLFDFIIETSTGEVIEVEGVG
jgi:predicted small secreted protein